MNAEQKQRAADLLSAWRATAYALHGDRMAALLQELVDAPEVLAATNPSQVSSSAEPPAPAEANDTVNMSRDCEHGQLARSCNICDLARELKAVTEQRDKLLAALEKCVGPLELYNAYGWPDRECVIQKTKATIAEAKGQS